MSEHRDTESRTEMLAGKIVAMSPRPTVNHNQIIGNLYLLFASYLRGKSCRPFMDGYDVYLTPTDRVIPDFFVVCNPEKIKYDGVHGAPDLIVEVLSPSTALNDRQYKMQLYAHCGIGEYWIISPNDCSVEIYALEQGRYQLQQIYSLYPDYLLDKMSAEERQCLPFSFSPLLLPDMVIPLSELFDQVIPR